MRNFFLIALLILFKLQNILAQGTVPSIQEASDKAQSKISKPTNSNFSPSLFVNPFIGTGGHGHTFPGATAPFWNDAIKSRYAF